MKEEENDNIEKINILSVSEEGKEKEQNENIIFNIERDMKDVKYDRSIKIILLGNSMVGKSSIINRLCKKKI